MEICRKIIHNLNVKNEVGLKHIAFELGVSITTVSRALSDAPDIGEDMKAKVRSKAIELKYVPNQFAKSLSTGRSNVIGIIVDSLVSPYFSYIVDLISREIKKRGFSICLYPTDHAYANKEDIKELLSTGVAGVLSFIIPKEDAAQTAALSFRPMLLFGRWSDLPNLNVFCADDVNGGRLAANYLAKRGCKRLAYIPGTVEEVSAFRYEGFKEYCDENGLECRKAQGFEDLAGIDGVFTFDDQLASYLSVKHPDIPVVGFNGLKQLDPCPFQYQDFPSIGPDYRKMVGEAVAELITQIKEQSLGNIKRRFEVSIFK